MLIGLMAVSAAARTVTRDVTDEHGNQYSGDLVDGVFHGTGRMEWVDGRTYEGEFRNGWVHGQGVMTFPNGETYNGTYHNEIRHGQGELVLPNGDIYTGAFFEGTISGKGEYIYKASGERYVGFFDGGLKEGFGSLVTANGRYVGGFRKDKKHGFGVEYDTDGSEYRGYFSKGERHGDGVLESELNERRFQKWDSGELVSDIPIELVADCQLTINDEEWMFSSDQCIDGLAHGEGPAISLDGSAYISHGKFVLGHVSSGVVVSLENPESD